MKGPGPLRPRLALCVSLKSWPFEGFIKKECVIGPQNHSLKKGMFVSSRSQEKGVFFNLGTSMDVHFGREGGGGGWGCQPLRMGHRQHQNLKMDCMKAKKKIGYNFLPLFQWYHWLHTSNKKVLMTEIIINKQELWWLNWKHAISRYTAIWHEA